uniref:Late transcription factor VLTF3-like protein n=1 Tax=viral metagenome TaxID=1070528 RepID=A0A6C0LPN5_9ZZZZ
MYVSFYYIKININYSIITMFKEKSSKKKYISDNNEVFTLDAMHNNIIKKFELTNKDKEGYKILLHDLEAQSNLIMENIETHKSIHMNDKEYVNALWTSNIIIREKIIELRNNIKELDTYNEVEYYKNTSYILFQYYDTVEKQSNISNPHTSISNGVCISSSELLSRQPKIYKNDSKKKRSSVSATTINVLDALNNLNTENNLTSDISKPSDMNDGCGTGTGVGTGNTNTNDNVIDKSSLVDKYMSIINKKYVRNVEEEDIEICKNCKNQMTCLQHDAIIICNLCGYQELLLVEQNRPILKQNTKDTSHFSYKRINHFREWCNQVQGKESTDIPDEIFEKILTEIKKEKIVDTKTITYNKMRDILKRLRINKYYEHINYIINRINGIPTPQFSQELEDKLCNMFRNIQAPFLKHCPKDRKNFLSYSYVLYKFFQILGLNEYLKYFPLLKSREKLYVQDQIWKKICIELNYEIIPSL